MSLEEDVRMLLHPNQPDNPFIEWITGFDPSLRYVGFIGGGGQGDVYLIENVELGQLFARKVSRFLKEQDKAVVRNEARNINKLSSSVPHPNIIRVFRHGFLASFNRPLPNSILPFYYMDMELGRPSLYKYIETRFHSTPQSLPFQAQVWNILSQLATGIEYMHKRGVVHRDIKPDNIIPSWTDPDLWKVTDFGISVISSGDVMSTRIKQGSDQYIAPEILRGGQYCSAVDIWGIGCLVYELFTGHRTFNSRSEIESYDSRQTPLPEFHYPSPAGFLGMRPSVTQVVASQNAYRVLSATVGVLGGRQRDQLEDFWMAFKKMSGTEGRMVGDVCADELGRFREINGLLKWMLDCDPRKRPSIQVVAHHFRGYYLRSMLESDESFRLGVVDSLINPTRTVSGITYPDIIDRWQFVIKLEAICAGKNRLQFYKELNILAKRFVICDAEDIDLNNQLFELLSRDFQLSADFKKVYVYGLKLKEQDRNLIIRELRPVFPPVSIVPHPSFGQQNGHLPQQYAQHRKVFSTGSVIPAQYMIGLGGFPIERNQSEQSDGSACFRMTKMSLEDTGNEKEVLHYASPENTRPCGGEANDEDDDNEQSIDGDPDEESLPASGQNSLQHSLYKSQLASEQSLQQSLRGSFTGTPFADENEREWVFCCPQPDMLAETQDNGEMGVEGVGMGEIGV